MKRLTRILLVAAAILFFVTAEFTVTAFTIPIYKAIYLTESKLLSLEIQYSRYAFPSFYWVRIVAVKILLVIGICWLALKMFSLLRNRVGSKLKNFSKPVFVVLLFFIAVHLLLLVVEHYTSPFQPPGFTGNANKKDTLIYYQQHLADSVGMNYENRNFKWGENQHVNQQGFLADIDYTAATIDSLHALGKKVVFVIGDSFVEGVSETVKEGQHYNTYDSTFIRLLNAKSKNYTIFSFGIGGSDPLNYQLIASKFLPALKPDLFVVCFCHNDVFYYDRKATPFIPKFYQTNYGWLSSNVPIQVSGVTNLILPTADSAFDYYMQFLRLENSNSLIARLAKRSTLFSNLYLKLEIGYNTFKGYRNKEFGKNYGQLSFKYLQAIEGLCNKNKVPFLITYIPAPDFSHPEDKYQPAAKENKEVFFNFYSSVFFPTGLLTSKDYISEHNRHFNDEGNRKYAAFLDSVISLGLKAKYRQ